MGNIASGRQRREGFIVDAFGMMPAVKRMFVCGICMMLLCVAASGALPAAAEAGHTGTHQAPMRMPSNSSYAVRKNGATIDFGNATQGYVMIKHEKTDIKLRVRISMGATEYTYVLNGQNAFEVFPLQMGSGKYRIQVLSRGVRNYYTAVASKTLEVDMADPNIAYLYPNQYVNYSESSKAVAKAAELCEGLQTDREKFRAIYNFCSRRIIYNFQLALAPSREHRVDVDKVLAERKGICLDYAVLMACMLRSQGIPAQVVIGHADGAYHAWNKVLLEGKWYRCDATYAATSGIADVYQEERHY